MTRRDFFFAFIKDLFRISGLTYVVFFLLELWRPGLIVSFLNLNFILIICLLSAIIIIVHE